MQVVSPCFHRRHHMERHQLPFRVLQQHRRETSTVIAWLCHWTHRMPAKRIILLVIRMIWWIYRWLREMWRRVHQRVAVRWSLWTASVTCTWVQQSTRLVGDAHVEMKIAKPLFILLNKQANSVTGMESFIATHLMPSRHASVAFWPR